MHARLDSLIAELVPGQLFRLERAEAAVIEVVAGKIWVTEAGRPADAFVHAGERHRVSASSVVLVEALEASRLVIRATAPMEVRASTQSWLRTMLARGRTAIAAQ